MRAWEPGLLSQPTATNWLPDQATSVSIVLARGTRTDQDAGVPPSDPDAGAGPAPPPEPASPGFDPPSPTPPPGPGASATGRSALFAQEPSMPATMQTPKTHPDDRIGPTSDLWKSL